jgi:hypothetical protein
MPDSKPSFTVVGGTRGGVLPPWVQASLVKNKGPEYRNGSTCPPGCKAHGGA